ncbi:MAG: 6-phosphofructokinase [Fimbriimonadaceae bacterium]|jgi:6-phosphofructokinase 1|nr:6-phosphofructokinase [Fimbriimonadaceae bacterium]
MSGARGRIGILTAGGDCPGLNAVISGAVHYGIRNGYEFVGFQRGFEGILTPVLTQPLTDKDVSGISHIGGTILHTTNRGRFGGKVGVGNSNQIPDEILEEAKHNLQQLGIDALIIIGGDGSLSAGLQLSEKGVRVIGVPKTIDNDLAATDQTFGFSTALTVAVEALDRVHTTATSHDRLLFVEVMGRHTGWIALKAGLAGGADAILLPEFPFQIDDLVAYLRERRKQNKNSSIVVVAEGAMVEGELSIEDGGSSEVRFAGVTQRIMKRIEQKAPDEFEMRATVVGHIQRGGTPNARDRILARAYGVGAIDALLAGENAVMVSLHGQEVSTVPLIEAVSHLKAVGEDVLEYQVVKKLGIFMH